MYIVSFKMLQRVMRITENILTSNVSDMGSSSNFNTVEGRKGFGHTINFDLVGTLVCDDAQFQMAQRLMVLGL